MPTDDDVLEEVLFPAAPLVAESGLAPSPYNFLFTGEDTIRTTSHNAATGVVIAIQGRMWSAARGISTFGFTHTPNTDRSAKTELFQLGEGYLLNLSVFAQSGAPRMGQTFVRVQVIRGFSGATYVLGTLVQDYLTSNQDLAWPGSPIRKSNDGPGYPRLIDGTAPAAGAESVEVVPTGASWEILTILHEFTTSAAAADRIVHITATDGATDFLTIRSGFAPQAAGFTLRHHFAVGAPEQIPGDTVGIIRALPSSLVLRGGQSLETNTTGIQAGDQYGSPDTLVIERLEAN